MVDAPVTPVMSGPPASAVRAAQDARLVLRRIAGSLRRHVDDLTSELVSLVLANEEVYARAQGVVSMADLVASCRANLDALLLMLADAVPPGDDPLETARGTGRVRAEQHVPLGALLHAYRLGGQLVWRGLLREARGAARPVTSDDLLEIATVVWEVVDRAALAATESYRSAEWQLQRRDENRRAGVLHALLEGHPTEGASEVLGIPPHGTYLVAVADMDEGGGTTWYSPDGELRRRGMPSSWHPYRGAQVGLIALGHTGTEREARRALAPLLRGPAGVSPAVRGLSEVAHAYRLALLARRSLTPGEDVVAWLDDRLPEALVAAHPELAVRLARRLLDPLLALRSSERDPLLRTIEAWVAHGASPGNVAAALFCHRNTVLNRVHRIEALTGTSLDDVRDLAAWTLALVAARLFDPEPDATGGSASTAQPGPATSVPTG